MSVNKTNLTDILKLLRNAVETVEEMMDESYARYYKYNLTHLSDILFQLRYDIEDLRLSSKPKANTE